MKSKRKLAIRVAIGLALLASVFGAVWLENGLMERRAESIVSMLPSTIILAGLAAAGCVEACRLVAALGLPAQPGLCALGAIFYCGALLPWGLPGDLPSVFLAAWLLWPLVAGLFSSDAQLSVRQAAGNACVILYVAFLLGFLVRVRALDTPGLLLAVVLATKSSDIFAYLTGWALGRHKAIPRISPGKTWEGYAGGAVGCSLVTFYVFWVHPLGFEPVLAWPGLALAIAILAPIGDLIESLLKRAASLKDSGQVLPEFGGVLDLIDSLLLTGPAAYLILETCR